MRGAIQASREGLRSLSCHSSRGRRLCRRDSNLDSLQDKLQEKSPELRSLHLEKLVGRGSFGRVYKGEPLCRPNTSARGPQQPLRYRDQRRMCASSSALHDRADSALLQLGDPVRLSQSLFWRGWSRLGHPMSLCSPLARIALMHCTWRGWPAVALLPA